MNKGLKITSICLLSVLTLLLIMTLVVGVARGGTGFMFGEKNVEIKNENISLSNTQKVKLNFNRADTKIILTDSEDLKVVQYANKKLNDKYLFQSETSGDTVTISDTSKNIAFCIGICFGTDVRYEIYLPKTYHQDLEITTKVGDVNFTKDMEDYNFKSLKINNSTGDITLQNEVKTGNLKISTTTGDVELGSIISNDIDIRFTTADLNVKSIKSNATTIRGTTGDIELGYLETKLDLKLTTGDIEIDEFNIIGDSDVKATVGDMDINLSKLANCNITIDSTIGDRNLPNGSSLVGDGKYKLNVKTTTGDVNIK